LDASTILKVYEFIDSIDERSYGCWDNSIWVEDGIPVSYASVLATGRIGITRRFDKARALKPRFTQIINEKLALLD
jgi:hypothetical protein